MRSKPLIVHALPWQLTVGGAQRIVMELAKWATDFAEVHLVYLGNGSDETWRDFWSGVKLHPVAGDKEAERLIDSLKPDLIHQHYPAMEWGVKRLIAKYPIIGTPHNWAQNAEMILPDWVACIAGPQAAIRHGVDLDLYRPAKRELGPAVPLRVGIAGRLHADKMPTTFLKSLSTWRPNNIQLHIFGRGLDHPITRRVEAELRRRGDLCVLHGDVPAQEMPERYRSLHCLLVPSRMDSVSLVAIEAMATGLPVVARRIQGLPDTIGDAGLLCDSDHELFKALEWLRDEPLMRARLGETARKRAEQLFDIRRMLDQYGQAYRRVTKGRIDPTQPGATCPARAAVPHSRPETAPTLNPKPQTLDPVMTVALPIYNGPRPAWFQESVNSVLAQEGACFELLIIDDGCTDEGLLAVIDKAAGDERVRVIRMEKNQGIAAALNRAIQEARGYLIARADGDDIMPAGRLAQQYEIMREHPEYALICGNMTGMKFGGRSFPIIRPAYRPDQRLADYWLTDWCICHPTVCYRADVIRSIGGYDESLAVAQDLDLWCRLEQAGARIGKFPNIWNSYRVHSAQATAGHDMRVETERILKRYREGEVAS